MARSAHPARPRALPRPASPILVALYTLIVTTVVTTADVTPTDPCTITLTASPSTPTPACSPLTLTAAVARSNSTPVDGVVTFYANGRAVTPSVALVDGSATAVVTSLTPEAYTLAAAYTPPSSPGNGCSAGVSAALTHGVRKAVPALSVMPVPASLTPPADCDITRAQFWVAARPPPGCPPATGGLFAYLVPGAVRDPAVWRPLAPPGATDAVRVAAAAVRGGQAAASTAWGGVSELLGGAVGAGQPVATATPTLTPPSPSLPALEPARLPDIVRAVQAGYAVGRQAQASPQAAAESAVEAPPQPAAPRVNTTPHTPASPSPSLTLSLLTHRPDARIDAAAASRSAHAGAVMPPRALHDRRRLRQATAASIINATTLVDAGAGSPLGHLVLGAAPLLPSSIIPGALSRGGITPAAGVVPPGDYTIVVQYSGDPNYEAGAVGGAFVVDRGCVFA